MNANEELDRILESVDEDISKSIVLSLAERFGEEAVADVARATIVEWLDEVIPEMPEEIPYRVELTMEMSELFIDSEDGLADDEMCDMIMDGLGDYADMAALLLDLDMEELFEDLALAMADGLRRAAEMEDISETMAGLFRGRADLLDDALGSEDPLAGFVPVNTGDAEE